MLSPQQIAMHLGIIGVGFILFIFARRLLGAFYVDKHVELKVLTLRSLIVLFFVLQIVDIIFHHAFGEYENILFKLGLSITTIYFGMVISQVVGNAMRRRFGKKREVDNKDHYLDTYSSRLANIFCIVGLTLFSIYCLIKIWELDSLLETTGFFGLVFAFLAFTNAIWAPDIYYGMVILNSEIIDDGDTIRLNGDLYIINRVTFVYTILLNLAENNRTLIRNSKLLLDKIENLTRLASSDGLREKLVYKVGYPPIETLPPEERERALDEFLKRIDKMFAAIEKAGQHSTLQINSKQPFKWFLSRTGDYALEFTLVYSLKPLPVTRIAKNIRQHIEGTRYAINELVYRQSIFHNVNLSTPIVVSHANSLTPSLKSSCL